LKTAYSTFGRKRDLQLAGASAQVTVTNDDGTEVITTLGAAAPCRVLNAKPVPQVPEVRWDHKEKLDKKTKTERQRHGMAQPSWTATARVVDGSLRVE
jgi:hypothetical protein